MSDTDLTEAVTPDLPEGFELLEGGAVRCVFARPVSLSYKDQAGAVVRAEEFAEVTLNRLHGSDVMALMDAKGIDPETFLLAAATGMPRMKLRMLLAAMDAADLTDLREVFNDMLGLGDGLPDNASVQDDGTVALDLRPPATDDKGAAVDRLVFRRLNGGDLNAIGAARNGTIVAVVRAAGLTQASASAVLSGMDAADYRGVQRVVRFLSTSSRRTGR